MVVGNSNKTQREKQLHGVRRLVGALARCDLSQLPRQRPVSRISF